VPWSTLDGTATAGSDYVAASGTATFNPGETAKLVTITINGDLVVEPSEAFTIRLGVPTGADLGKSIGVVTITNDDSTSVGIGDASVSEGNSGTKTVTLTLTLSAASATTTSVAWTTADGTATAGSDYVAASGTATFAAGTTSTTLTVTINGDTGVEPNETFTVVLSNPAGLTIGDGSATVTITNDDGGGADGLAGRDRRQRGRGRGNVGVFTITAPATPAARPQSALVWGGTATAITLGRYDGTARPAGPSRGDRSTITLRRARRSATVRPVTPIDDTAVESRRAVTLAAAAGTGYTRQLADARAATCRSPTTTRQPPPTISIQSTASVVEGNNQTRTVTLVVTLSAASTQTVTVAYATANGTATAGSDYVAKSGTLTFAPGVLTQTISIVVNGDRTVEPNETFTVTLSGPVNATLAAAVGTVTITNDDGRRSSCPGHRPADSGPAAPSRRRGDTPLARPHVGGAGLARRRRRLEPAAPTGAVHRRSASPRRSAEPAGRGFEPGWSLALLWFGVLLALARLLAVRGLVLQPRAAGPIA
jgi:chitinase